MAPECRSKRFGNETNMWLCSTLRYCLLLVMASAGFQVINFFCLSNMYFLIDFSCDLSNSGKYEKTTFLHL